MILSRVMQFSIWIVGICFFFWVFTDPQFRNSEGFLEGGFCLPFSVGIALILLGYGVTGRFRKFTFWFALALVGQAVSLQMIEAGHHVRYQHYKPLLRLLTEIHPILLFFLLAQTVLVVAGLKDRWPTIRGWFHHNFKYWQLLCVGVVFFISSATVSQEISRYAMELLFASLVQTVNLGNIILIVWTLPPDTLEPLSEKLAKLFGKHSKENNSSSTIRIDRFAILAAIWIMIAASSLNYFIYERHPHIPDEITDFQHAKYLADGALTSPAPSVPDAFDVYLMQVDGDRWYPAAPVGWPAVLSLGVLLKAPWLVNPALAGLNMILIYLLVQEIFSRYTARMSLLLLCTSPWYVFMGMSFMTHMSTLTCALCAALAICKARKSGKAIWGWLGGGAVGMVSLIRPLEGLIVASLLGLWSIGLGGKRLKTSAIMGLVIGSIMVGSVVLFYNRYLTGDPTVFPINEYCDQKFGPKSNALGFGPERGMGWPIDPFPGHSPIDALVNANLNTFSINIELYGWSTGCLILAALLVFSGVLKRGDYIMIAVITAVFIPHFFYYFSGGPDFGARYWFLMLIPLVALTVRGMDTLETKLNNRATNPSFASARVKVGVLSLCFFTLVNYFPWRATDKYHHYRGMRPDIRKLASEYGFGRSLVLIRGDYIDYPSAWFYNPIDLRADAPIYAWDRNSEIRTQLLNAYPDRLVWVINGPSITNKNYRVVEGPLSSQKLLDRQRAMAYDVFFSTYVGGSDWEHARDIFVDAQGYVYITGGTASPDFPTTPGAYCRTFSSGGTESTGECDVFISKFGPTGNLIWSTYLGGPNYDRGYGIEVDKYGYVYVSGRAGVGFPTTAGVFQPNFNGSHTSPTGYGYQNGFVAKLSPDGSQLIWASYVGVGGLCRDIAIDDNGDIYVPLGYRPGNGYSPPPSQWFTNAYQKTPQGGQDCGVIKIRNDGTQVIWATYLGGTGDDSQAASIRVDSNKNVFLCNDTESTDIPTTTGAYDRTYNGGAADCYIAKLNSDGSNLIYGTYIGSSGDDWISTHNLAIDNQGNAYVAMPTHTDFPTTSGAFQSTYGGGNNDIGVAKFSNAGALIASTFIGGNGNENADGIYVDDSGNVFITGVTQSKNFPGISGDSFQSQNNGGHDAFLVMLLADFKEILYSTYMGGSAYDNGRAGFLDRYGNLYITGSSDGNGWPIKNAYQDYFKGGGDDIRKTAGRWGAGDCILAKFRLNNQGSNQDSEK
jgi:hypothetical protein